MLNPPISGNRLLHKELKDTLTKQKRICCIFGDSHACLFQCVRVYFSSGGSQRSEVESTVSRNKVKDILEQQDLKRVPGFGLIYTELVQGIPPIFPHLIEKIPTIHSVIVFITVKHLPIPHVDVSERFLFRQVEPKELMVFRCVARYGYRDTLEMANGFVKILVEYLQYYIRDINLYGLGEPLRISDYSAHIDSFSKEKPSGHAIYAEEMLTPIQSFSELTMHPVGMSNTLTHLQVIYSCMNGSVN